MSAPKAAQAPLESSGLDSVNLSLRVKEDYLRYFESEFPVRDGELRQALFAYLRKADGPLFRGPFIHVLEAQSGDKTKDAYPIDRRLLERLTLTHPYPHQANAWELLVGTPSTNVILTTGTGTGKTEALLVPLIHDLLTHPAPGLRAILLYPMNALLKDQYHRLTGREGERGLLDPDWRIRAAEYTGDTSMKERQAILQGDAPAILLTNYKMLELMLLRGELQTLLEKQPGSLQWLFYDELHTYIGVRGAEVALLNRRLKAAAGKTRGELRCIAASATTGDDEASQQALLAFATNFFDEPFEPRSLLGAESRTGAPVPPPLPDSLTAASFADRNVRTVVAQRLAFAFSQPRTFEQAAPFWRDKPSTADPIDEITQAFAALWPHGERLADNTLEHRVHLLVRGSVAVEHPPVHRGWDFSSASSKRPGLPIALCRSCGEAGFSVRIVEQAEGDQLRVIPNGGLQAALEPGAAWLALSRNAESRPYLVQWEEASTSFRLSPADANDPEAFFLYEGRGDEGRGGAFTKCPFCGDVDTSGEQIRRIASGSSSNVTVLAASLFTHTAPSRRKLITFADSRQDAALQTGFTNDRMHRLTLAALLAEYARAQEDKQLPFQFHFGQFFDFVANTIPETVIAKENSDDRRTSAWLRLAPAGLRIEFLEQWATGSLDLHPLSDPFQRLKEEVHQATERMFSRYSTIPASPEATGLLAVQYIGANQTSFDHLCGQLSHELKIEPGTLKLLVRWMLDNVRRLGLNAPIAVRGEERASNGPRKITLLGNQGRPTSFTNHLLRLVPESRRWDSETKERFANELLRGLSQRGILTLRGRNYELSLAALRFTSEGELFSCTSCRVKRTYPRGMFAEGIPCPGYRCKEGTLKKVSPRDQASLFYFRLAQIGKSLVPIHAAEHSSWVPEERRRLTEDSYNRLAPGSGQVNLLVATPTLEMGVDLKRTPAVLLRNVPPLASNYRQRAGRAGRDNKSALVITHAGASPFDTYFFEHPERLVEGKVHHLTMPITNAIVVSRHIHAYLLQQGGEQLRQRLSNWRNIFFDDDDPTNASGLLTSEGSMERAEERLVAPLATLASTFRSSIHTVFALNHVEFATDKLDALLQGAAAAFRNALHRWRETYRQVRREYFHWHHLSVDNPEAESLARRFKAQALSHLGYTNKHGTPELRPDAPLFYLADLGFLPRYEFPGELLSLHCNGRGSEPNFEVQEDVFKALRDWAPGGLRRIWAVGGKYKPQFFRAGTDDSLLHRYVCTKHAFVGSTETERCWQCGGGEHYPLLQPTRVEASREGAIDDSSEERMRKGTQSYFSFSRRDEEGKSEVPLGATVPENVQVSRAGASALLYLRQQVDLSQVVGTRGRDRLTGYRWCSYCHALRQEPQQAEAQPDLGLHTEECQRQHQGAREVPDVLLFAKRSNVTLVEIHIPAMESLLEDAPKGVDVYRSVLEALLQEGKVLCELGPRGEGLAGTIGEELGERYLVFYDPVPGGAGTIESLWRQADKWFSGALARVSDRNAQGVGCVCSRACDRCLLDYANQQFHGVLSRHAATKALRLLQGPDGAFWEKRDGSEVHDPVQWDHSSPLEAYFAKLVCTQFAVTGTNLQSQRPAIPNRVVPDYKSRTEDRFLFIDSRKFHGADGEDPDEDWARFVGDCGKRNEMLAKGKLWISLTHRMIRNQPRSVANVLAWLKVPHTALSRAENGTTVALPQGTPLTPSVAAGLTAWLDRIGRELTENQVPLGFLTKESVLHPDFLQGSPEGILLRSDTNKAALSYAVKGLWRFDRFFEDNQRLILAGYQVYLLPLDVESESSLRTLLAPMMARE